MTENSYTIGLVLSGGGARGFAHLGLLQALNESGIFPDVISGTSAGAIVGSLYADGHSPREIMHILNSGSRFHYFSPTVPKGGLLQISGIIKILKENLRAKSFEDLKIPLFVTATDLNNGTVVYFSEGELLCPVIASATSKISCGLVLDLIWLNSSINASSICKRPAVSRMTTLFAPEVATLMAFAQICGGGTDESSA